MPALPSVKLACTAAGDVVIVFEAFGQRRCSHRGFRRAPQSARAEVHLVPERGPMRPPRQPRLFLDGTR